jgi:hypothetical protein
MFTHLRRHIASRPLSFRYRSCGYGPNLQVVPDRWLNGDENAIVDFRFAPTDKLTWYFDHHVTAFANDEQRDQALAKSERYYFDPDYGSCTKLIVDVGRERYGVDFSSFEELTTWADKIDRAGFESAADAIDRHDPIKQLAAVVEQHGDTPLLAELVDAVLDKPLEEVCNAMSIQEKWIPIRDAGERTMQRIEKAIEMRGDVVFTDLHDAALEASGKFVAYALAPSCVYSVALIRMRQHFKVSVGFNPWGPKARSHDIGRICQRFGGGGHPVVGAVSLPLDKLDEARRITDAIIAELHT